MADTDNGVQEDGSRRVTVEARHVDGIAAALGREFKPPHGEDGDDPDQPPELDPVVDTIADVYRGVEIATEQDSRGRSRKMVREYAELEDLSSDQIGHVLRVLEGHDLVAQDGNRWRIPAEDG